MEFNLPRFLQAITPPGQKPPVMHRGTLLCRAEVEVNEQLDSAKYLSEPWSLAGWRLYELSLYRHHPGIMRALLLGRTSTKPVNTFPREAERDPSVPLLPRNDAALQGRRIEDVNRLYNLAVLAERCRREWEMAFHIRTQAGFYVEANNLTLKLSQRDALEEMEHENALIEGTIFWLRFTGIEEQIGEVIRELDTVKLPRLVAAPQVQRQLPVVERQLFDDQPGASCE